MNEKEFAKNLKEFLEFRKKFSALEWYRISRAVQNRLDEKANDIELDDSDIELIVKGFNL